MKLMTLLDSGIFKDCKIAVFTGINAGTSENFTIEIMRGQRANRWRAEYDEWLHALDLEVRSVGAGGVDESGKNYDVICFHCEPIKMRWD